ncbi:hypothetical protein ACFV0T_12880 [Streptomyces sp. NPDC059582]|uniref:hypothetical protein n=1 Tax=Streptomyces sp. NPDC059582 TaxID=3346875 RepID=UPI003683C3D9
MAKKKKKRSGDQYQLPPKAERARQISASVASRKPRPPLPPNRAIWGGFGLFLLFVGFTLALWLPSHSLVQDLRSRGITVDATVTAVDNHPKYVKVLLAQGPKAGSQIQLWDYSGMYPDAHVGDSMVVTYDPTNPSHSLSHEWVTDPPVNLPVYGTSALALLCLAGTVVVVLHRRKILRTFGPETPPAPATAPTPLTKS